MKWKCRSFFFGILSFIIGWIWFWTLLIFGVSIFSPTPTFNLFFKPTPTISFFSFFSPNNSITGNVGIGGGKICFEKFNFVFLNGCVSGSFNYVFVQ